MKVAIVGGSRLTRDLAPHDDPDWEIWVLGNQIDRYGNKRISTIFEIHDNLTEHGDPEGYLNLLRAEAANRNAPLILSPKYAKKGEYGHVPYPYDDARQLLGGDYFTSSPAYMMAYALLNPEVTDIGIYGVEMAVDDHEYFRQRTAMYAWIGYAKAKGIKIHIPEQSSLFKEPYNEGRDWNNNTDLGTPPFSEVEFQKMVDKHQKAIDQLEAQREALANEIRTHHGCIQSYEMMKRVARAVEGGAKINSLTDNAAVKNV